MTDAARSKPRVLYVDDERENLIGFKYVFRSNYEIHLAGSAEEAREIMRNHSVQVVIADQRMPGETGVEFLEEVLLHHPETVRMIVTGYSDMDAVIRAINKSRIHYYFHKPWNEDEMRMVINDALRTPRSNTIPPVLLDDLAKSNKELGEQLKYLAHKIDEKTRLVDEIRHSGHQLRVSEERFRAVFEAAQDCIFIKDTNLRFTHVNPAMLRFLDRKAEDMVARTDEEVFGVELARGFRGIETRVLKGQVIEAEHTLILNGDSRHFSSIRIPLRDSTGSMVGICGIARDLSDRRERDPPEIVKSDQFVSEVMRFTLRQVSLAAQSDSTVLLLGESGSGKDYLARHLHEKSRRKGGPFFTINCAALAPELADSELFGHEPGAFTGSRGRKRGLLELAEGGTLLLNEVGELSPQIQAKLLTFLDTQSFARVGGEAYVTVNARLVAATNRDLEQEVERGNFRKDLFYRLNVFPIRVPALRERLEDVPMLVPNLLKRLASKLGLNKVPQVEPRALDRLKAYSWPGNVRELENILERAIIVGDKREITEPDLTLSHGFADSQYLADTNRHVVVMPGGVSMNEILRDTKRVLVSEGMRLSEGSVTRAAMLLGISRGSLKHYLKQLGIRR